MADWPPGDPELSRPPPGVVWCWRILLDAIDAPVEVRVHALLTAAERERSARFQRAADRRSFVAARAALRVLLAAALGTAARTVPLVANAAGKPQMPGHRIEFNVSHSGGIALIALAGDTPVGTDVERVHPIPDRSELAARFFHPREVADLAALSEPHAEAAFFRCWTRKEAVAKALGLGLSLPLDRYRVSCLPHEPAQLLILSDAGPPPARWSMFDLVPAAAHVGAIAIPHRPMSLICRTLDLSEYCRSLGDE